MIDDYTEIVLYKRENLGSSIGLSDSKEKKLTNTIQYALDWNMYSCQICLGSMQSFTRSKIEKKDIINSVKLQNRYGMNIFSHYPYVSNLCGSSKQLAWNGNKEQDNKTLALIKSIEYELDILSNFNKGKYKGGTVIHIGSSDKSREDKKILQKGMETIAQTINKIKFPEGSMLYLENSAGERNKIGKNIDELMYIYNLIKQKDHVSICLDTAHLHGSGDFNLSKIDDINNLLYEFDSKIGLDKLQLIHLNDSRVKLGSCTDAHQYIGQGFIWNDKLDVLTYFLDKTRHIPTVLETSPTDYPLIQSL